MLALIGWITGLTPFTLYSVALLMSQHKLHTVDSNDLIVILETPDWDSSPVDFNFNAGIE